MTGTFAMVAALAITGMSANAQPVASAPYTLTTFVGVPPSLNGTPAFSPDDLAVSADGTDLWVGYQDMACTDGSTSGTNCSGPSQLVEYDLTKLPASAPVLQNISVAGHIDGLKIDPATGDVWATENEDGNPTISITKAKNGKTKVYGPMTSSTITGGFDDLVFSGVKSKDVFITASSQVDTTTPVIVQLSGKPKKKNTTFTSTLAGAPTSVWNVVTNAAETGDTIGDPDSMTLDAAGELVLDNRNSTTGGSDLYIVRASTATNPILKIPLTLTGSPANVNDTVFTNSATSGVASTAGTLFITDTKANAIYLLTKPYFPSNEVYTAANSANDVGLVDLNTGVITPVVTGFQGLHGLAFSPTAVAIAPATTKEK